MSDINRADRQCRRILTGGGPLGNGDPRGSAKRAEDSIFTGFTGLIILAIIGLQVFSGYFNTAAVEKPMSILSVDLKRQIDSGKVARVTMVKESGSWRRYLPAADNKAAYDARIRRGTNGLNDAEPDERGALYHRGRVLREELNNAYMEGMRSQLAQRPEIKNTAQQRQCDRPSCSIHFLLPIILLVAMWFLIMRKMGGAAGGAGGAGGIFNIGKSKAQLFEKGHARECHF